MFYMLDPFTSVPLPHEENFYNLGVDTPTLLVSRTESPGITVR